MKIIVNRGIDKILTKIVVLKNAQEIVVCPIKQDYCVLEVNEGDQIVIKLRFLDNSTLTVASFAYQEGKDIFYISPTLISRRIELAIFKILPCFCALFYVAKTALKSNTVEWIFTGSIVLTVFALLLHQICMLIPFIRKKLFTLEKI
jgi:hypothetical protein